MLLYSVILLCQKNIKLNSTQYYENSNQTRVSTNRIWHSSHIDFKDFKNFYKKCTAKPYSLLVIDTTRASDNPLRFKKNLLGGT